MRFHPRFCPRTDCPAHRTHPFRFRLRGMFLRQCDGRWVQRFLCLECRRTFSTQTFRLDYRLHRPQLSLQLWGLFISKVTHRQAARILGCRRRTVAHRLALLGEHCRVFHRQRLAEAARAGGLEGMFQLDELETFENSRRLQPLTVPVLIHRRSFFVVDVAAAPLACRGSLSPAEQAKKLQREALYGRRRSGSRQAVEGCLETLAGLRGSAGSVGLESDCKPAYALSVRRVLGERVGHGRYSSELRRDRANPLFAINHTLAQMRDGVSRLVRRSWAASKKRGWLECHLWIWVCWRNYVRGVTNKAPRVTPAMALGVIGQRLRKDQLLARRIFPAAAE